MQPFNLEKRFTKTYHTLQLETTSHCSYPLQLIHSLATHPANVRQREDRGRAKMQLKRSCAGMPARPPPTRATRRLGARRDLLGRRRRALGGLRRPPPTGPQRAPQAAADGRSEGSADAADGSTQRPWRRGRRCGSKYW
jgi:hypothetical protein